jgi:ABC-type anion transport system duplicated permease subunit
MLQLTSESPRCSEERARLFLISMSVGMLAVAVAMPLLWIAYRAPYPVAWVIAALWLALIATAAGSALSALLARLRVRAIIPLAIFAAIPLMTPIGLIALVGGAALGWRYWRRRTA